MPAAEPDQAKRSMQPRFPKSRHVAAREREMKMAGGAPAITKSNHRAVAYPPMRISSVSEDDTLGTCSPSEAREMATRVLLKTLSTPVPSLPKLLSSSETSTLFWPLLSSATLPGVAEVRISALSGAEIGARPCEKERKRRS